MAPLSKQKRVSDCRNRLYGKSTSLRCGGELFRSPGLAAAKALVSKDAVGLGDDSSYVAQ